MPDRPTAKSHEPDADLPAGVAAKRQLVFPDAVARDNQVRSRIPLAAEAPVFEFEAPPEPPQTLPRVPRRWRMRFRQFIGKYVVWFVAVLLLSVATVVIVAIFSPQPKPPTPPVRR
ncbi:MAG: hypothetical protein NZ585_04125 [Chloracidobacterium sp.]|nr:hypothetical protein [Chloracidobacterium sp.]MDW8216623.1 hypothetical protein [Acidobacteriota bacterium]